MVDAETCHNGDEPCLSGLNFGGIMFLPAQERLLHHVFGIRHAAEHPVGDAKKEMAVFFEEFGPRFCHGLDNLLYFLPALRTATAQVQTMRFSGFSIRS